MALTYDDGPSAYTPQILDVLEKQNAVATFFVVGNWVDKNQDVVKKIHDRGHEIGNHTFNHPDITNLTNAQLEEEILKCEEI